MKRTTQLKRLARRLLATTCLTACTAMATTISEPPNFGTTFGTATPLPEGTTTVEGSVSFGSDMNDFFYFQDLVPGTGFYFTATTTSTPGLDLSLLTTGDAALPGSANPYTFTASDPTIESNLNAPANGVIVFDVLYPSSAEGARFYTITVNTVTYTAPEPGTLGAMGLGLAAGAALKRRRRKKI
jgi:hypothetical protein